MLLILLIFLLICSSSLELFFEKKTSKLFYVLVTIIALVEGIRWYSGVDFYMYYNSYQKILDSVQELHNKRYDIGYYYLSFGFKKIGVPYTFFLVFIAFLSVGLHAQFIKKYTPFPILALLVNFVCLIGFLGNNRQQIALALVVFGTHYLLSEKRIIFLMFVMLASLFHFTALPLVIFVFLDKEIKIKYWLLLLVFVLLTLTLPYEKYLYHILTRYKEDVPFLHERFSAYKRTNILDLDAIRISLGGVRRLLPICLLLYFKKEFIERKGYFFFLNISIFALLFYVWANFNFIYLLGRFTIYLTIYECIVYSWGAILIVNRAKQVVLVGQLLFYIFCIFLFYKGISIYPDLFMPYKTIFN